MGKRIHTRLALAILPFLLIATPSAADVVWFDETGGGQGSGRSTDLAAAYADSIGLSTTTINFDSLPTAAVLADQCRIRLGMTLDESFFAVAADRAAISRAEIRDNSTDDFANALVMDKLLVNRAPASRLALPEPVTAAFLIAGTGGIFLMNRKRFAP